MGGHQLSRKTLSIALVLLGLWLGLFPLSAFADTLHDSPETLPVTLTFLPDEPTIADQVVLTVSGEWQNGCTPQLSDVTIFASDHVVRVDARSNEEDGPCSQAVTPYSFSADLHFDLAGTYQVFYYVQDGPNGKPLLWANAVLDVAGGLRVSPAIVTVDEPVHIVVSDISGSACVPTFDSYSVSGNIIFVDLLLVDNPDQPCATVATPWSYGVTVTDLQPGIYSVQVRTSQMQDGLRTGSRITASTPLVVLADLVQIFVPLIANGQ